MQHETRLGSDVADTLTGPELLDNIADTESGDGRQINGQTYRAMARMWRRERQDLAAADRTIADLQGRLDRATQALAA